MHRKLDIYDLDIPKDDIDCWERYPKYRWVYETSRLLEKQNVNWAPFKTNVLTHSLRNITLESSSKIDYNSADIYIQPPEGEQTLAEVYVVKGEIKLVRFFDKITKKDLKDERGYVDLRVSAFVSLHFQKFSGVISAELIGKDIYRMSLKPLSDQSINSDAESLKLIKRIYKRSDVVQVIGPTDQTLQESIAS